MAFTFVRDAAVAIFLAVPVLVATQSAPGDAVSPRAKQLHDAAIVVDSHDDTTQRLIFDKAFWAFAQAGDSRTMELAKRAKRAPDPFYFVERGWLVRRLAPDCGKVELGNTELGRVEELLEYMGRETANVHLGTRGAGRMPFVAI